MNERDQRQGEHVRELAEPTTAELRELIRVNEQMLQSERIRSTAEWLDQRRAAADEAIQRAEFVYSGHLAKHREAPMRAKAIEQLLADQRAKLEELMSERLTKADRIAALVKRLDGGDLTAIAELKALVKG